MASAREAASISPYSPSEMNDHIQARANSGIARPSWKSSNATRGERIGVDFIEVTTADFRLCRICATVLGRWQDRCGYVAAVLYDSSEGAKRNGLDPFAYLRNLLQRIRTNLDRRIGRLFPTPQATRHRALTFYTCKPHYPRSLLAKGVGHLRTLDWQERRGWLCFETSRPHTLPTARGHACVNCLSFYNRRSYGPIPLFSTNW